MDKQTYLSGIRREADDFVQAARTGLDASVPSCPDWNVAQLTGHLGVVYGQKAKAVRAAKPGEYVKYGHDELTDFPQIEAWLDDGFDAGNVPPGLVDWFQHVVDDLLATLSAADPSQPCWTWWEPDQTAGFWMRRMAHESAVHRWDAQLANDTAGPIEGELARDGIDEIFDVMVPVNRPDSSLLGTGESYHFHRTDGEGEWLIRFDEDLVTVSREHSKGDVAARGSASDLLLFLWHRIPKEDLDVAGKEELLDRYFELVPPS